MPQSILAVDDEPHMLILLERIITEKTGYRITTTSNSLEVPNLLEENEYDLIISDLKMPGLDGIGLLRHLSEHKRCEAVVLMTAFGSAESATEARSLGVFDYITKPFKQEHILSTVERAMRYQKLRRDAARLSEMLGVEPFDQAAGEFRIEYVRHLIERVGKNPAKLSAASGLPVEEIEAVLAGE
jgi:DNA-binding NtrC family response regulator